MQTLKALVEQFDRNVEQYKNISYKEAQIRADFIDKFFILLGWDIYNANGRSEAYRDCIFESSLKVEGKSKNPDYTFKIGIESKFFVEAKKPSINIKYDVHSAFQLRRYSYSASLPLSVLTDFEEFAIYDTRIKPKTSDQANVGRVFYCNFKEYEKYWDYIHGTFAKESILNGSFDEYAKAKKKGTSEVDKEFLKEIESWRELLAKNIALRNKDLNIYDLNQAVQTIIDRIIFLRIAIDRNIESDDLFASIIKVPANKKTFQKLDLIFFEADKKYNSGLFKRTGDRKFIQEISIDDKPLLDILKNLEVAPYAFNVMPIEILGSIYERFLGKTIRLTASHQAKVEEKPEVRKAGGVYYTPKYIVDYIVNNTVGEKLKNKKPANIERLTILDPACGSGSFLVNAYEKLLNWHLDHYSHKDNIKQSLKKELIYEVDAKTYRLTIKEKQHILLSHIYGVDIDRQAVEVTKLSLLLKLMEGESSESSGFLFKHSDLQLLPDLSKNIKCGNSLIGKDFYEGKQISMFTVDEQIKINTFDWEAEGRYIKEADRWVGRGFPEIMKQGGFDVVIGNPPYGASLTVSTKEYLVKKYPYVSDYETAQYFIAFLGKQLSKNGFVGYIIPNTTFLNLFAEKFREYLVKQFQLKIILNLDDVNVFENASVRTSVPILAKYSKNEKITIYKYVKKKVVKVKEIDYKKLQENKDWSSLFQDDLIIKLRNKILATSTSLKIILDISQGLIPYDKYRGHNEYTIKNRIWHTNYQKDHTYKKELRGGDITRYNVQWNGKQWISYGKWLAAPRRKEYFTSPRLLFREITDSKAGLLYVAYTDDEYYNNPGIINAIKLSQSDYSLLYLLGIVNSKLIAFLHYHFSPKARKGLFPKILVNDIRNLPIKISDFSNPTQKSQHDSMVSFVDQMLTIQKKLHETPSPSEKQAYQQQADILDEQIDELVYELYDLTPKEIKIVEGIN